MGSFLSHFRKRESASERLAWIVQEIKAIEEEKFSTQKWEKQMVSRLIIYSGVLYVVAAAVYFVFLIPPTPREKFLYSVPMLLFPLAIYGLKRVFNWYYSGKLQREQDRLVELYKEKAKIVEAVMETETFRVARELLEKYAPEQLRKLTKDDTENKQDNRRSILNTPLGSPMGQQSNLRNRGPASMTQSRVSPPSRGAMLHTPGNVIPTLRLETPSTHSSMMRPQQMRPMTPMTPYNRGVLVGPPPGPPLPRPVPAQDRSILRQVIDGLMGEGPGSNYALICQQCKSHNGLAMKEEFEYLAFRCAYCYTFNPARKVKPPPPRLMHLPGPASVQRAESLPGSPRPSRMSGIQKAASELQLNEASSRSSDGEESAGETTEVDEDILGNGDRGEIGGGDVDAVGNDQAGSCSESQCASTEDDNACVHDGLGGSGGGDADLRLSGGADEGPSLDGRVEGEMVTPPENGMNVAEVEVEDEDRESGVYLIEGLSSSVGASSSANSMSDAFPVNDNQNAAADAPSDAGDAS